MNNLKKIRFAGHGFYHSIQGLPIAWTKTFQGPPLLRLSQAGCVGSHRGLVRCTTNDLDELQFGSGYGTESVTRRTRTTLYGARGSTSLCLHLLAGRREDGLTAIVIPCFLGAKLYTQQKTSPSPRVIILLHFCLPKNVLFGREWRVRVYKHDQGIFSLLPLYSTHTQQYVCSALWPT